MRKILTFSELNTLAEKLADYSQENTTIALIGDLGTGKTTFTKTFAKKLGVTESIKSPTFNYVLEYFSGRLPLYHFDVYRLGEAEEIYEVGYEDYLNNGALLMAFQSVVLAPILEELLFRGLVFRSLRDKSKWLAIFASSFLFGFLHIYSALFAGDLSQLIYLLSYGGMGFAFSYAYEKRKTICVPILMHMINNLVAIVLLVFM